MDSKLQTRFNRIEAFRNSIFAQISGLSEELINRQPQSNSWSVAQVLSHLMNAEQGSTRYVVKKIQYKDTLEKAGIGSSIRSAVLKYVLKAPIKYKASTVVADVPGYATREELEARWLQVRSDLNGLLESLEEDMLDKTIFKHPVGGRLTIYQALDFMAEHIEHHRKQVNRILQHVQN